MSSVQPYQVIRGLGQTHDYTIEHQSSPITQSEIENYLAGRGYVAHIPVPVEHDLPLLTRSLAISTAVDVSIDQFNSQLAQKGRPQIQRTSSHFYRCPSTSCAIDPGVFRSLVTWATMLANGYLTRQYTLPYWAVQMLPMHGLAGLSGAGLGGFTDWLQENPWFITTLGALLTAYGAHLTAKQVEQAIKDNVPTDYLKKEDMQAILAALQQAGVIPPGQEGTVAAGVSAATTPSWMWPVAIAGGIVVGAFLLLRK